MAGATLLDSEAGRVLLDFSRARLLAPFMARPMTIPEAARYARSSPSALAYWVRRFVDLGLLRQVGERKPHTYQAVSAEFMVDLSRTAPLDAVIAQMNQPGTDRLSHSITQQYQRISEDWMIRIYVDGNNLLRQELVPSPFPTQAALPEEIRQQLPLDTFGLIRLNRRQAKRLADALMAVVLEAFQEQSEDQNDDNYFLHIALTRDTPPE